MIEPGIGTRSFKLGIHFDELDFSILKVTEVEDREIFTVYKTESIWFFVNKETKQLEQLSLFPPFSDKVLGKIGLGDTLSALHNSLGTCCINHKVHEPINYPGIAFETEKGSKSEDAKICCISVSKPYPFYGELPKHIKSNLPNKPRKLP